MNSKDRLLQFLKYLQIGQGKFENTVGLSNGYINNNKGSIGTQQVTKISNAYPDLNVVWLVTGEGEMLLNTETLQIHTTKGVPYYEDLHATASIITSYNDNNEIPTFYINYQHFNDCAAYIPVVGDSMYPRYASGEIVAIKKLNNFDIIQWGEAFFVVTNQNANDMKTIKLIYKHEDETKLILKSSNPNFNGETVVSKNDIISLFIIKGKITRNQF